MSRLYLDENIGSRFLIAGLIGAGYPVTFARDLGYANAPDDAHFFIAAARNEVLITNDAVFVAIHGALVRFARLHDIRTVHARILVLPQRELHPPDYVRLIHAFAAQLPIANALYRYRTAGGWTRSRLYPLS